MKIPVLAYIAMASSLIPLFFGIARWKKLTKPLRYFVMFMSITILQVGLEYTMGRMKIHTNLLSDIYRSIEVTFLLLFFKHFIKNSAKHYFYYGMLLIFFCSWIVTMMVNYNPAQINSFMVLLARILLVIGSVIMIHDVAINISDESQSISQNAVFWIGCGVLLYCSGTFLVVTLGNEIMKLGIDYFFALWKFNWSFFIISNLFFSFALYRYPE